MEHTIWDAVICNTSKVRDVTDYVFDSEEEAEDFIISAIHLGCKNQKSSALDVIKTVCNALLGFPTFNTYDSSSEISAGMLVENDKLYTDRHLLEDNIVYEILYPNLFGVLSLEAIGRKKGSDAFLTLAEFKRKYGFKEALSLEQGIKPAHLPEGLRNLFVVERKSEKTNSPYQIGTNFPELLYAILENIHTSPLSKEPKTSNSLSYSKAFYDKCVIAISPNGVWSKQSFAEFYLFERIFRLNAKLSLACFEYDLKGELTLSPELLRDFFFHSPLAIFDQNILGLFYKGATGNSVQEIAKQFLHFMIQLSAYWVPCILRSLRNYMQEHEIQSFDDVCEFFFPESKDFEKFSNLYTPSLEKLSSYRRFFPESECAERRARDTFSERWSKFRPSPAYCAEAYTPLLLDDWSRMLNYNSYQDPMDSEAAQGILSTLS